MVNCTVSYHIQHPLASPYIMFWTIYYRYVCRIYTVDKAKALAMTSKIIPLSSIISHMTSDVTLAITKTSTTSIIRQKKTQQSGKNKGDADVHE